MTITALLGLTTQLAETTWTELVNFEKFSDATVYFSMASLGSVLFALKMIAMMLGGDIEGGGDFDLDADADGGLDDHGTGFSLFSLLSILAFMMGAGWMGVACRVEWEIGPLATAAASGGFGFFLMLISSFGMFSMRKMNESGSYDVNTCVGEVGRVYLKIPAKGSGQGQVEVNVEGRKKILRAVSSGEEIESFASVKVTGIHTGETVIVEKY
jgi:hypothetical protein